MTGNSVEKCFAVWNVIEDALSTLKPNIYSFLPSAPLPTLFCFA